MNKAQRKNLIIKIVIVIIVLSAVSIYMFSMRANAENSDGDNEQTTKHVTFHIDGQTIQTENKGVDTVLPSSPKKQENYFIGWYIDENEKYIPCEENSDKDISVYAKFSTYKAETSSFLNGTDHVPNGTDYVFKLQNEKVIIQNRTSIEHPFTNQMCEIVLDIFSGDGILTLKDGLDIKIVEFELLIDYSSLDYHDITKGVALMYDDMVINLLSDTDPFVNATNAILNIGDDIKSAVGKFIRYIANTKGFVY